MVDYTNVITSYATEADDGRIFFVRGFGNEDFYMMVRDEEGLTQLGRANSLTEAQETIRQMIQVPKQPSGEPATPAWFM